MSRRPGNLGVLLLVLSLVSSGCQNATKHYTLTGEVLAKNESASALTVSNNDIPGFMPAMTMDYLVKDAHGLEQAQPGDRIRADVVVDSNNNYWLEQVIVTDESKRGSVGGTQARELEPGDKVPDVPLVNQDGKTLHLANFKGKAVLVTFIYTRCPFPKFCPLITSEFAEIHNTLAETPAIYKQTHLLSVTLDPTYDTAPVLRKYGLAYLKGDASGFAQWDFVSTSPAELQKLASGFGLVYYEQNNQITHSLNTILLGPNGTVEQMWPDNDWKVADVVAAMKKAVS